MEVVDEEDEDEGEEECDEGSPAGELCSEWSTKQSDARRATLSAPFRICCSKWSASFATHVVNDVFRIAVRRSNVFPRVHSVFLRSAERSQTSSYKLHGE